MDPTKLEIKVEAPQEIRWRNYEGALSFGTLVEQNQIKNLTDYITQKLASHNAKEELCGMLQENFKQGKEVNEKNPIVRYLPYDGGHYPYEPNFCRVSLAIYEGKENILHIGIRILEFGFIGAP